MLGALRSAIDKVLAGQASRLTALAKAYKQRLIYEVKTEVKAQVVAAGVMAALVVVGLFMMIAVCIGFAALYYWVALMYGTLVGLAVAGGAALVLSLLMFTIVAMRSSSDISGVPPELSKIRADARDALRKSQDAVVSLTSNLSSDLGSSVEAKAAAIGRQSLEAASGIVRDGSREAVLATLVATAVIGLLLGRATR